MIQFFCCCFCSPLVVSAVSFVSLGINLAVIEKMRENLGFGKMCVSVFEKTQFCVFSVLYLLQKLSYSSKKDMKFLVYILTVILINCLGFYFSVTLVGARWCPCIRCIVCTIRACTHLEFF